MTAPYIQATITITVACKLQNKMQLSLNSIDAWCNKNGFKISINKTIGVLFTKKHRIRNTSVKVGNERIKIEKSAKFLGVVFDHKLSWKPHLEYIIAKCKSRMNLMRAVSSYHWGASKKALLLIYKSLIRSVIDYGDVVYSTANK